MKSVGLFLQNMHMTVSIMNIMHQAHFLVICNFLAFVELSCMFLHFLLLSSASDEPSWNYDLMTGEAIAYKMRTSLLSLWVVYQSENVLFQIAKCICPNLEMWKMYFGKHKSHQMVFPARSLLRFKRTDWTPSLCSKNRILLLEHFYRIEIRSIFDKLLFPSFRREGGGLLKLTLHPVCSTSCLFSIYYNLLTQMLLQAFQRQKVKRLRMIITQHLLMEEV